MNVDTLKAELIRDEGLKLKPYTDTVGKLTIGVGRNIDDIGITEDEAKYLLSNDIARVEFALKRTFLWYDKLSDCRQRALCNLCFNLGLGGLLGFKKALSAMEYGKYDEAAKQFLDSKWAKQVGARSERIADLIRKG